jgi:hypothetical protein
MTTGTQADFKIYQEQFFGGMVETLAQFTNTFNGASNNSIRLVVEALKGQYAQESFFKNIVGAVARRDVTSVSAVTDQKLTQDELVSVKLNRKIGPVANTLDAFRKIQASDDDQALSFLLGTQFAKDVQVDYLNTALTALVASTGVSASTKIDVSATGAGTMTTDALVSGLALFGDAARNIVCWVMHSKVYYDLVRAQIAANTLNVSDFNIVTASPVTLGRPVIVTDSAVLVTDNGASPGITEYFTLGLAANGAVITESENRLVTSQLVTGNENIIVRIQGEYAYNLGIRGHKWDVSNGGANPTNSAIGTGSNWDAVMDDIKNTAGVRIKTK